MDVFTLEDLQREKDESHRGLAAKLSEKEQEEKRDGDIDRLKKFFSESFIEEVQGETKLFKCFQGPWGLTRFHNACIKNGNDGIIVGFEGSDLDWGRMKEDNPKIKTAEEWSAKVLKPISAMTIPPR